MFVSNEEEMVKLKTFEQKFHSTYLIGYLQDSIGPAVTLCWTENGNVSVLNDNMTVLHQSKSLSVKKLEIVAFTNG